MAMRGASEQKERKSKKRFSIKSAAAPWVTLYRSSAPTCTPHTHRPYDQARAQNQPSDIDEPLTVVSFLLYVCVP